MAERPKQNWEGRDYFSLGPKFRIDLNNPQMGGNGTNVYSFYGVTDNKDVCLSELSEGGTYRILNDNSIELHAGEKNVEGGIDIVISAKNGDITITAMKNGQVRIKGANVMIQADEDIDLKAGRNITLKSGSGRILLDGNKADVNALAGNLIESTTGSFVMRVFEGSFVGIDFLKSEGVLTGIGDVVNVVGNVAGLLF
jgi:hypothetical protein